jgi:hypothetical protein
MADLTVTATQVALIHPLKADVVPVKLAEAVAAGQAVYQATDGTFGLADANAAGKQQFRGVALQGGGAGQVVDVVREGEIYGYDLSGLDYDAPIYLSDTAGALADAAGTLSVQCGRVAAMTDKGKTKVLYLKADWLRTWA